jgi:RAB protein geranylgeranyltransferase component A
MGGRYGLEELEEGFNMGSATRGGFGMIAEVL